MSDSVDSLEKFNEGFGNIRSSLQRDWKDAAIRNLIKMAQDKDINDLAAQRVQEVALPYVLQGVNSPYADAMVPVLMKTEDHKRRECVESYGREIALNVLQEWLKMLETENLDEINLIDELDRHDDYTADRLMEESSDKAALMNRYDLSMIFIDKGEHDDLSPFMSEEMSLLERLIWNAQLFIEGEATMAAGRVTRLFEDACNAESLTDLFKELGEIAQCLMYDYWADHMTAYDMCRSLYNLWLKDRKRADREELEYQAELEAS
jgi:hypothetical protein